MSVIKAYSVTNIGCIREINQDSFYLPNYFPTFEKISSMKDNSLKYNYINNSSNFYSFAVFDGMGGMNAGEKASGLAAELFDKYIQEMDEVKDIEDCIKKIQKFTATANLDIYKYSKTSFDLKGMGTTFVGLCFVEDLAVVLNAGDSRCYLISSNDIEQLSEDHTRAAELMRNGFSEEDATRNGASHILQRFLGLDPEYGTMVSHVSREVYCKKGDKFLLCSDGLYGMVSNNRIFEIVTNNTSSDAANLLVEEAKKAGGNDNITVIIVEVSND